jgi:hypothetical protein
MLETLAMAAHADWHTLSQLERKLILAHMRIALSDMMINPPPVLALAINEVAGGNEALAKIILCITEESDA